MILQILLKIHIVDKMTSNMIMTKCLSQNIVKIAYKQCSNLIINIKRMMIT